MKVFGNELRYMNFQGLDSLLLSNNFNIIDVLTKLSKENSYQFTHSTTFLDSSIIIPTSSGFPMNLTVNGTATIDLQANGKVDLMKLAQSNLDIHGLIRPRFEHIPVHNKHVRFLCFELLTRDKRNTSTASV